METEIVEGVDFAAYIRKGDASGLARLGREKSGKDSEGGYLVPDHVERRISAALAEVSPIRSIAAVRQIGAQSSMMPTMPPGSAAPGDLSLLEFPAMELYAMPAATQSLLDDALIDVEAWVADECQYAFAAQESAAFVNGDGTNKPRGILNYQAVPTAEWRWGTIGYVASGAMGAFAASNPADALIDLAYSPKQVYRQNGRWLMNRQTEAAVRKLRDAEGQYIWQPAASAGQPATLLGFPVTECEDMPNIAANSFPIAFGDFRRGYLIADRQGVRILRDPYSAKPYVLFYTTKRVGGGVMNFEAIKLLKMSSLPGPQP